MEEGKSDREAFIEGFVGVSRSELEEMPDVELAQWQAGWKAGTEKHILAEKEWTRRLTMRELREQFKLEEQVARVNRWWSVGAAFIGVVGTLAGAVLGAWWQASSSSAVGATIQANAPASAIVQGTQQSATQPDLSASTARQAPRAAEASSR